MDKHDNGQDPNEKKKKLSSLFSKKQFTPVNNLDLGYAERSKKIAHFAFILIILVLITIILKELAGIFRPLIVSLFFIFILEPIVRVLKTKLKIPQILGYFIAFSVFVIVLYFSAKIIVSSLSDFSERIPIYETKIDTFLQHWNQKLEIVKGKITFSVLIKRLPKNFYGDVLRFSASTFFDLLSFLFFMLVIALFYLLETQNLDIRIIKAVGIEKAKMVRTVYKNITMNIKRYLVSKAVINVLTALYGWLIMIIFGLDFSVLFAFIVFFLLWIPYIGSFISVILPTIVAFLQFPESWEPVVFSILLIAGISSSGTLIEPKILGRRLNVSPLLVLMAMTFGGWLWGLLGVILAVPITVAIKIIFENFPATKPVAYLMSETIDKDEADRIIKAYNSNE